jgi:hypothetical protein
MADAIDNIGKGRGRPATGATPVMVRLPPDQLAKVDRWREAQDDKPTRPEAIRRIVSDNLSRLKY